MQGVVPYIHRFMIQVFIRDNSIIIKKGFKADMKFIVFLCYKDTVAFFAQLIAALSSKQRPPVSKGRQLAVFARLAHAGQFLQLSNRGWPGHDILYLVVSRMPNGLARPENKTSTIC
ncbi:hypothetical protein ACFX12_019579 [Malus domestica]